MTGLSGSSQPFSWPACKGRPAKVEGLATLPWPRGGKHKKQYDAARAPFCDPLLCFSFPSPQQRQPYDDPYMPRTCDDLLKWKFDHLNSVDFKLDVSRV